MSTDSKIDMILALINAAKDNTKLTSKTLSEFRQESKMHTFAAHTANEHFIEAALALDAAINALRAATAHLAVCHNEIKHAVAESDSADFDAIVNAARNHSGSSGVN